MNKIVIVIVAVIFIILLAAVFNVIPYMDLYAPDDITEFSDVFDYSAKPITNWNESSHEFKFKQNITSIDNEDFENVSIDVLFYNHGKQVGVKSSNISKTENGTFDLNFTVKLDDFPDAFYYNVTDLDWVY